MKLSIVIVNYNVRHFLEQCLRSVFIALEGIDAEVYVVDNNSVDGSVQMLKEQFPGVLLIANSDNKGFSRANNQAIRRSKAEYVLLLNPDTIVPENAFEKVLGFMDEHPEAGALGVRMLDGQGIFLPESKRGLPTPEVALYKMMGLNRIFPKSRKFGKYHLGYLPETETHEVDVLSGAFMLLRREALEKTGLLDETFFMYGEDIDLSYRMTLAGYKNYYYAGISIIHYKGESTKKSSVNYVRVFYKAMIIFAQKHYKGRYRKWFTGLINIAIYLRAGIALVVNLAKKYWLIALELFMIFGVLYFLKEYWEEHIKFIDQYPPEMLYIHLPYYTLCWIVSLFVMGAYKYPFKFARLVAGMLIGTGLIFMILGLLPDKLHFSRGIILFGALLVTATLAAWRTALHLIRYRTLDFSLRDSTRSILIGSEEKWKWLNEVMSGNGKTYQKIGFLSEDLSTNTKYLGAPSKIFEVVRIFKVNEVIFDSEALSSEQIMKWMNRIGPQVSYYIIPSKTDFLIGSHSRNDSGLYLGQQIELNLSKAEYRNQKRFFDLLSSFILILLSPLFIWFKPNLYFQHCLSVFFGKKTWKSYTVQSADLPKLKPGVYNTVYNKMISDPVHQKQLDEIYARTYTLSSDLNSLLEYLFR